MTLRLARVLLIVAITCGCSGKSGEPGAHAFEENRKNGDLTLAIVGDYFSHHYVLELARITKALSPGARQILICTGPYESSLQPLLAANDIENVSIRALDESSVIYTQWARDMFVGGSDGESKTIIASPYKHARSKEEAQVIGDFLKESLPEYSVTVAPFVFEGGNVAFVSSRGKHYAIVGRKVFFDNRNYQRAPWAAGYDDAALRDAMAQTFDVDSVIVVGRADKRPPVRMYFEYHIDMGMVILKDGRAVVSRLEFGDRERAILARTIAARHPVITPFAGDEPDSLFSKLSDRLETVAMEYEDYASVLGGLGLEVFRSPVDWRHVLGSMSWTNVAQAGDRLLMPVYPDSLLGVTEAAEAEGGQLRMTLDVSNVTNERFELRDLNLANKALYESLGYEVVEVPEYLHYMMGGIHCFVNVVE